jgi:hypothetical protein
MTVLQEDAAGIFQKSPIPSQDEKKKSQGKVDFRSLLPS